MAYCGGVNALSAALRKYRAHTAFLKIEPFVKVCLVMTDA